MLNTAINKTLKYFSENSLLLITVLLAINFSIRLIIYYNTSLFKFSDFTAYFNGVENIINGKKQYLLVGNFLFATSYLGYFAIHVLGNIDYFR